MTTIEERVSRLEGAFEQLVQRLDRIEARLDRLEAKIDTRIDGLYRMMVTMMLVMITGGIAIAGAIVTLAFRI